MNLIQIFSDGGCDNLYVGSGTDIGSWACLIKYNGKEAKTPITGLEEKSTNNRMEVAGITKCLPDILKRGFKNIEIISDSKYLLMGINAKSYRKRLKNGNLINADLWRPIFDSMNKFNPTIKTTWIKGHNGHIENEKCDKIAKQILNEYLTTKIKKEK